MSNVIQFLETLGRDAALSRLPAADYEAAVAQLEVDSAQRRALLNHDTPALNDLLGGRNQMRCLIAPPHSDEQCNEDRQWSALRNRDHATLNELLGGREKMYFAVFPADDDEQQGDEQPGREEPPVEDTPESK